METQNKKYINDLGSTDDKTRLNALQAILGVTENKVDWAYEVWDDLLDKRNDANSYQRSIAIQVLCNMAKSDPENRIQVSLDRLLAHTRDEKFITSRQCIQSIWKIAAANEQTTEIILDHLEKQFEDCAGEKHYNLLRQDIIQSMRLLYECKKDDMVLARAEDLVNREEEEKYRKKYVSILKI